MSFSFKQTAVINWYHIEEAQELAKESPKPVFMDFTADWCGWCKKMDKTTFGEPEVVKLLNEKFYSVKVDYESKEPIAYQGKEYTAKELAKSFGINGLPTMVVASSDFSKTEVIVGYQKTKQFLNKMQKYKKW